MIVRKPRDAKRFIEILKSTKFPVCCTLIDPDNEYVEHLVILKKEKHLEQLLQSPNTILQKFKHCDGVVEYHNPFRGDTIYELLKWS